MLTSVSSQKIFHLYFYFNAPNTFLASFSECHQEFVDTLASKRAKHLLKHDRIREETRALKLENDMKELKKKMLEMDYFRKLYNNPDYLPAHLVQFGNQLEEGGAPCEAEASGATAPPTASTTQTPAASSSTRAPPSPRD